MILPADLTSVYALQNMLGLSGLLVACPWQAFVDRHSLFMCACDCNAVKGEEEYLRSTAVL